MIPRKQTGNQIRSYISDPLELLKKLNLSPEEIPYSAEAIQQFQFKVPFSYADKIQLGNPHDPLLRQIFPLKQELSSPAHYQTDPLAEVNSLSQPGLLQKYQGRALLLVTPVCAINCRYCFRRHYPYDDKGHLWGQIEKNIQLIKQDQSVSEVILSGGDPLSLSDKKLEELMSRLASVAHLKRVRIHTRFPIVDPKRITNNFLNIMDQNRMLIIMVLHINHAQEIGNDNQNSIARLRSHQIALFNQSVLLKGVNDTPKALRELSETLIEQQIIPYYLHKLDQVQGSAHFEVNEEQVLSIYQELMETLPGYMLPRLVKEVPGAKSKLPIIP